MSGSGYRYMAKEVGHIAGCTEMFHNYSVIVELVHLHHFFERLRLGEIARCGRLNPTATYSDLLILVLNKSAS